MSLSNDSTIPPVTQETRLNTDGQNISSERQEPTFYAMIPKMAIQDLTPYELALYTVYKQTASDHGVCFKSNATLAKEAHMSVSRMKEARKALEEKGYIRVKYTEDEAGIINTPPDITIIDIWGQNHKRFALEGGRQKTTPQSPKNRGGSPKNTKEYPSKKNSLKKDIPATADATPPLPNETPAENLDDWFSPMDWTKAGSRQSRMVQVVYQVWGYPVGSARNTMMEQMLRGVSTNDQYKIGNLPTTHTKRFEPEELGDWHDWYMQSGVQGNDKVITESPMKVQASIMQWIDAGKPKGKSGANPLSGFQEVI
jgi:hypothetical protein